MNILIYYDGCKIKKGLSHLPVHSINRVEIYNENGLQILCIEVLRRTRTRVEVNDDDDDGSGECNYKCVNIKHSVSGSVVARFDELTVDVNGVERCVLCRVVAIYG